jgi:hypothetical protein
LPPALIPIGYNVFGDYICLCISGRQKGKIFFWDHERGPEPDLPLGTHGKINGGYLEKHFRNVHLIAKSYDDFILRIRDWEEGNAKTPDGG